MTYFVDSEEEVLIRSSPDNVCGEEELPREERRRLECVGAEYLYRDNKEDEVFR